MPRFAGVRGSPPEPKLLLPPGQADLVIRTLALVRQKKARERTTLTGSKAATLSPQHVVVADPP